MRIRDDDLLKDFTLNLTSLMDVLLMLLIFFMVATTFLDPEKSMEVDLPEAQSGTAMEEQPDEITINVLEDGSLILSGQHIDEAGLKASLTQAAQHDPKTPVTIRGDRMVHHERIVAVMDACGIAGLSNLQVGTLEAQGG